MRGSGSGSGSGCLPAIAGKSGKMDSIRWVYITLFYPLKGTKNSATSLGLSNNISHYKHLRHNCPHPGTSCLSKAIRRKWALLQKTHTSRLAAYTKLRCIDQTSKKFSSKFRLTVFFVVLSRDNYNECLYFNEYSNTLQFESVLSETVSIK